MSQHCDCRSPGRSPHIVSRQLCFQLVGDVLVEQTVADVLPKVEENEKGVSFLEGFRGSASSLLHIQSNAHTPTTQISMMKKKLGEQLELIKKQLVDLQVRSLCVWCYSYFFLFTPTPLFLSFAERVQGSFEANSSTAKWSRWCYGCYSVWNQRWWNFGLVFFWERNSYLMICVFYEVIIIIWLLMCSFKPKSRGIHCTVNSKRNIHKSRKFKSVK